MRRLMVMALGTAVLSLGLTGGAVADETGYRAKRVRSGKIVKLQRGALVARSYVPYVGYWRPPQPEPPSGPPGVATIYAYPYYVGPTPYIYPSVYAGYARHTPGYQYGIPRCECGAGFATPGLLAGRMPW
jgi:hypothetical protein